MPSSECAYRPLSLPTRDELAFDELQRPNEVIDFGRVFLDSAQQPKPIFAEPPPRLACKRRRIEACPARVVRVSLAIYQPSVLKAAQHPSEVARREKGGLRRCARGGARVAVDKSQNADFEGRACSDRRISEQLDQSPDRQDQFREIG